MYMTHTLCFCKAGQTDDDFPSCTDWSPIRTYLHQSAFMMHLPCFALCRILAWSWCTVGCRCYSQFCHLVIGAGDRHSLYALVWQHLWLLAEALWQLHFFLVFDGTATALKLRTSDWPRIHVMWICTPCDGFIWIFGFGNFGCSKMLQAQLLCHAVPCWAMGLGCYRLLQRCSILPTTELMGIIWWPFRLVFRPLRQAGLHSADSDHIVLGLS